MLCRLHRTVQGIRRRPAVTLSSRVPQSLRRPVAAGTSHLSHVQNGHPQALRIRGKTLFPI